MIALEDLYLSRLTGVNLGHKIIPDRRDFYPAAASPVTGQAGRQASRQAVQVKGMLGIPVKPTHSCIFVTLESIETTLHFSGGYR